MKALHIIGVATIAATVSGCILDPFGTAAGLADTSVGGSSGGGASGGSHSVGGAGGSNTGGSNTGGSNTGGSNTGGFNTGGAGGTGGSGLAPTTVMISTAGDSSDSWNTAANWDSGVPTGAINAEISAGLAAEVYNDAPVYAGTLTLHDGASLVVNRHNGFTPFNAIESASTIIMSANTWFNLQTQTSNTLQAIMLAGSGTEIQGRDDWHTTTINGPITGSHTLTFLGWNGHDFRLKTSNSFSGMICDASDRYIVTADSSGAFGTGDITVNPRADTRSAVLVINASDAMADTATLNLNGNGWNNSSSGTYEGTSIRLQMNADDTIARLFIDGSSIPAGSYHGATDPNDWIGGTATLTVTQ